MITYNTYIMLLCENIVYYACAFGSLETIIKKCTRAETPQCKNNYCFVIILMRITVFVNGHIIYYDNMIRTNKLKNVMEPKL